MNTNEWVEMLLCAVGLSESDAARVIAAAQLARVDLQGRGCLRGNCAKMTGIPWDMAGGRKEGWEDENGG